MTPTISVSLNLDTGLHELQATSHGFTAIAGPRLFRAPPWPDIAFQHEDAAAAKKDAATLRAYLGGHSRAPSKKAARKAGD